MRIKIDGGIFSNLVIRLVYGDKSRTLDVLSNWPKERPDRTGFHLGDKANEDSKEVFQKKIEKIIEDIELYLLRDGWFNFDDEDFVRRYNEVKL